MASKRLSAPSMLQVGLLLMLTGCSGGTNDFVLQNPNPTTPPPTPPSTISRSSVTNTGTQSNGSSAFSSTSNLGAIVAFESDATNLVASDTNAFADVFVHSNSPPQTMRVSVASDGTQGNGNSGRPFVSSDGQTVVFGSQASNLVPNDTNGVPDVFARDLLTGETTRLSLDSNGNQGNGQSFDAHPSSSGRIVVFDSNASNLVPNDTNAQRDIFVRDRQNGTTARVSTDSSGTQANGSSFAAFISADGTFVIFSSDATNLVPNDTNGVTDVFVKNLTTGATTRVSVDSAGVQGNQASGGGFRSASLSAEGRFAAFDSFATNLVANDTNNASDIFIRDLQNGTTTRVSVDSNGTQGNLDSFSPVLTADGRFVSFDSAATNLVANDTNGVNDLFIHDRNSGQTARVSVDANGVQGNNTSVFGYMSPDGTAVSFDSEASNLVPNDTNGVRDIFLAPNPLD